MQVYIAGTVTGSNDRDVINQDYRKQIKAIVSRKFPAADIVDPMDYFHDGLSFNIEQSVKCFAFCLASASNADMIIAYLPEASIGTGMEIYEAFLKHRNIVIITPMTTNWALLFASDVLCESIEEFQRIFNNGDLDYMFVNSKKKGIKDETVITNNRQTNVL